jgi:hypothetical protein
MVDAMTKTNITNAAQAAQEHTMANVPSSKNQERAMRVLGLASAGVYQTDAATLTAAGVSYDGVPAGKTWRQALKLSDVELLAALRPDAGTAEDFVSTQRNLDGDFG